MKRSLNLLVYYRHNPGKLDYHLKSNSFVHAAMFSAGFLGFLAAIVLHVVSAWISAKTTDMAVAKPVHLNLVVTLFLCGFCLWGAGMSAVALHRLLMVRDVLEEQGAVSSDRPDVIGIRLLGVATGAAVGVILAALFMLFMF